MERNKEVVLCAEEYLAVADRNISILDKVGLTASDPGTRSRISILPDHTASGGL
jgi:hypothetical protein